jgi:hypothetical protein
MFIITNQHHVQAVALLSVERVAVAFVGGYYVDWQVRTYEAGATAEG